MEREVGGGIGMGNTCKPMAVSFQCMTKFTTKKKKEREMIEMNLLTEQKQTLRMSLWLRVGGGDRELREEHVHNCYIYLKWITNKDLLYST